MLKLPCHCYVSVQCMSIYLVIKKKGSTSQNQTKSPGARSVAWHWHQHSPAIMPFFKFFFLRPGKSGRRLAQTSGAGGRDMMHPSPIWASAQLVSGHLDKPCIKNASRSPLRECLSYSSSPQASFRWENWGEKHCIRIPIAFRLYLVKIIQILTN
jgi:hypothetical protein